MKRLSTCHYVHADTAGIAMCKVAIIDKIVDETERCVSLLILPDSYDEPVHRYVDDAKYSEARQPGTWHFG